MKENISAFYLITTLAIFSVALIGMIAGCDEKTIDTPILGPAAGSGPVGGGESQQITLSASPSRTVEVGAGEQGTVEITALVENNIGQPMSDGQTVIWSATVGTLSQTTDRTIDGLSSVTLTFPKDYTGCSTVSAKSGDASASIKVCVKTTTESIRVKASDTIIDHGDSITITATVLEDRKPQAGVQVDFSVSGSGVLTSSTSTMTDASGTTTVTMRGNNTSGSDSTATVTAKTSDGRSGSVSIVVKSSASTPTPTPTSTPTGTPSEVLTLSADPSVINMGGSAGGTSKIVACAYTDGVGDANLQVNYLTTSSPAGAGSLDSLSDITEAGGCTDITVGLPVTFTATDTTGTYTYTINATTPDGRSASVTISVNVP
ncbi:hypothetical protein CSA56_15985 [candidate division KSB3 bacterium]|uniref:Big-1 domain-containing protein n=1 Tax=candidate division KSB3 bacterium TaxID=2044937 RepID=A0A2G6KBA3_9BACT|nr:MAG: hypothetical protein CSA56_15985 [candidate division KSB3 bacterium]